MRLINADALAIDIKECIEVKYDNGEYEQLQGLEIALECIDEAQTIEPERKKGKKIVKSNGRMGYWACDKCGETIHPDDNFCPNCGARLIEGVGLHDGNP